MLIVISQRRIMSLPLSTLAMIEIELSGFGFSSASAYRNDTTASAAYPLSAVPMMLARSGFP
jgi:hypothetical protein